MSTLRVTGLKQETSTATNISLAVGGGVTVAGISTFYNNTIFTNDVTVSGNISVGGTLTYQDVTDVDSIGIITARNGIHVSGGNVGVNTTTFPANGTNLKVSDGTISRLALDKTGTNARQFEIGNLGTGLNIYDLTADAERLRITSDGDILLGLSTKRTNTFNATVGPKYQIEEVGSNDASIGIFDCSGDTGGGRLLLAHQRSGAVGGNTVLNDNDLTGMITFQGNDGTHFVESAAIAAEIDGTPGTDDMPGALVLKTTNVGAAFATEKLRIDSSGNMGLGKSNNLFYRLTFQEGAGDASRIGWVSTSGNRKASIDCGNTAAIVFRTGATEDERMRVDSSGKLLHGKISSNIASDGTEIQYSSGGVIVITQSGNGVNNLILNSRYGAGTQYPLSVRFSGSEVGYIAATSSSASFISNSDYRLKENVVDISDGINRIKQLKPKRFNFIVDADTTVDGFLAHEAQTVVPESVTGEKDGETMQGMDQSKLVPLLTAALQEAIAKIETLEQRLSDAGIA